MRRAWNKAPLEVLLPQCHAISIPLLEAFYRCRYDSIVRFILLPVKMGLQLISINDFDRFLVQINFALLWHDQQLDLFLWLAGVGKLLITGSVFCGCRGFLMRGGWDWAGGYN